MPHHTSVLLASTGDLVVLKPGDFQKLASHVASHPLAPSLVGQTGIPPGEVQI